jgi:hypothetical protein
LWNQAHRKQGQQLSFSLKNYIIKSLKGSSFKWSIRY